MLTYRETDTWRCGRQGRTACAEGDALVTPTGTTVAQPFLDEQLVQMFDLATGAAVSHVDTVNAASAAATTSGWDNPACDTGSGVFGNLNNQLVTAVDDASGGVFVTSHTTATTNCYDVSGSGAWWVDKLLGSTVVRSVAYAGAHALPAGASAPAQTLTSATTWNANRTPATQTIQPGVVNQRATTTWTYPATSYGLPSQVSINAPDLGAALSPTRTTGYSYTKDGTSAAADGYFVFTTKNALNQTTTTTAVARAHTTNTRHNAGTKMKPDAIIEVRFKTTAEGGRQSDVVGSYYGCPLFVDGEAFDCRLSLDGKTLQLGESYELPVKFMNQALVLPKLSPGKSVTLWEGKDIATGKVIRLVGP